MGQSYDSSVVSELGPLLPRSTYASTGSFGVSGASLQSLIHSQRLRISRETAQLDDLKGIREVPASRLIQEVEFPHLAATRLALHGGLETSLNPAGTDSRHFHNMVSMLSRRCGDVAF